MVNKNAGRLCGTAEERINDMIDPAFLHPAFAGKRLVNYRSDTPSVPLADVFKKAGKGMKAQTRRGVPGQFAQ